MDLASYLQVRFPGRFHDDTNDALAFTSAITPTAADRPASCIRIVQVIVGVIASFVLVDC